MYANVNVTSLLPNSDDYQDKRTLVLANEPGNVYSKFAGLFFLQPNLCQMLSIFFTNCNATAQEFASKHILETHLQQALNIIGNFLRLCSWW